MNHTHNPRLTAYAQRLRREMTREERHLWYDFLKSLPVTVHRQKVLGPCIVDLYCAEKKLAIELDGSQHYVDSGPEQDRQREEYLRKMGVTVVRYTNLDVARNFDGVCQDILHRLGLEE